MQLSSERMMLNSTQIEHFQREGYLVVPGTLLETDLQPVVEEYDGVVDRLAADLMREGRISDACTEEGFSTRLASLCRQDQVLYRDADQLVDIASVLGPETFGFLLNARVLDLVEGIVGSEITCSPIQHVRCKLPADLWDGGSSYTAPWHQDAQVHTEEADPQFILTVWIPLVDTDEANGCLKVIPRVHRESRVLWSEGFGISQDNLPGDEAVSVPMHRGDVMLLHKLTPHCSEPNQTSRIRWSMDLRYQKSGTPSGRSCYPNFVARSRTHPESELRDWSEWRSKWMAALETYPTKQPRQSRPDAPVTQTIES
jgi:phytanoyl-CoA hydroxylase